jgi:hypothetical protein
MYYTINAVTFRRESLFSFTRVAIMIFLSGSLATCGLILTCLGSGLGIYNGLFHSTVATQSFDLFIYIVGATTLSLTGFSPEFTDLFLSVAPVSLGTLSKNTRPYDNGFLVNLGLKCKKLYNNLPDDSILKRSDSLVNKRIKLSDLEVLQTLYESLWGTDKDIQSIFTTPDQLGVPGVYCFMSKDRHNLSYYIGSSVNMRRRYNRHASNLNHKDTRNAQASPKFYNYVRKYGVESLDFGCLVATQDYLLIFSGFELQPDETSLLKLLTQLDLLIAEQYFLDTYGLSLNISPSVGTRESSILSDETRKKMSDAHLNLEVTLSKDK